MVYFDMDFKQIVGISENKMHLTVKIFEYTQWYDKRIEDNYKNATIPAFFKNSRVDLSMYRYNVWRPSITYTEANNIHNITETMYAYPNGTLTLQKELILTISCQFNYEDIPSDAHSCKTVAWIQNEFTDTAILQFINKFESSR